MKTNKTRLRGFTLVELLVVIVIIAALAGLSAPMILRQQKAAARTEAISNAKQVGLALLEFDSEFGSFPSPDAEFISDVTEATGSDVDLGDTSSSNGLFRQLIAYGIQSEDIFYTKTAYTREPDNVITAGNALEAGEVGFGYVLKDVTSAQNTSGNPGRPVLVTPLTEGSTDWTFDSDPYGGKAVVLRLDNSAEAPTIRQSDDKVSVGSGNTLESTGDDTVWGEATNPTLVAPDPA